jgi:signal transduction histidine kinase
VGAVAGVAGVTALASDLADWSFLLVFVGAAWAAGFALQLRRSQVRALDDRASVLERERDEATARERGRIARELHDVVSHHVMTTVVQAQAARARLGDDEAVRRSLDAIDEGGRAALSELRALLGLMRGGEGHGDRSPQPSLADVHALVDRTRDAGVPVTLRIDGDLQTVPAGVSLAAYRIVQEALTNVLRHGGGAPTEVVLDVQPGGVSVTVADRGPGRSDPAHAGHGLIGMAERASLYGGSVTAADRDEVGFLVDAWFPCEAPA